MLIKWIRAEVQNVNMHLFTSSQEGWSELSKVNGFLGQVGGWNLNNSNEACILGFWRDLDSYHDFMNLNHDEIYERSNQKGTFTNLKTNLYELNFYINNNDPLLFMNSVNIIRVAECMVKTEKIEHFKQMQKSVWNPGMSKSNGFFGGVFASETRTSTEFLVISL